jgi:hypothetical protein
MRYTIVLSLIIIGLAACGGDGGDNRTVGGVGGPSGGGAVTFSIGKLSDCDAVKNHPHARNLFCPASFSAAQTMVSALAKSLGVQLAQKGFFRYFQTPADPQAQTTVACLDTRAPWGSRRVSGAGVPLCHLVAYVTSPGPSVKTKRFDRNPLPTALRAFPAYFSLLYAPDASFPLSEFRVGSVFDATVRSLGSAAYDGFLHDYPAFAPNALYDPDDWREDPQYYGISGGGGGGWGGEIAVARSGAEPVMLAFGGGGGGGMTSMNSFGGIVSRIGAGGGGGVQLADGYRFRDQSYNGLGLGAGAGSDEAEVQYSYFDYKRSPRTSRPVHEYNPAVIADFQEQVSNLVQQLRSALASGETVVLRGGGGMGAGAEYLMQNGEEFEPHALSTQAGFQFRYEFRAPSAAAAPDAALDADQEDAYAMLGEFYRRATADAYQQCGRDYSNFACMCPVTHATVICLMGRELGDPTKIPAWLQQQHCPNDPDLPDIPVDNLTSYQHLLLDNASATSDEPNSPGSEPSCKDLLRQYFESVNA